MKGVNDVVQDFENSFQFGDQSGAVNLLKKDHQNVKQMFAKWESAHEVGKKRQIRDQLIKELLVHESVEEDFVYPILEDSERKKVKQKASEGLEQQHFLRIQLAELVDIPAGSPLMKAKMSVLKESVLHHAQEEESVLFPALKSSGVDLDVLGQQILKRKQQLLSDAGRRSGVGQNENRNALLTGASGRDQVASAKARRKKRTAQAKGAASSQVRSIAKGSQERRRKSASGKAKGAKGTAASSKGARLSTSPAKAGRRTTAAGKSQSRTRKSA